MSASVDGLPVLKSKVYSVEVRTGDRRGAGTDANVFIQIYGKNNVDSGVRQLSGKGLFLIFINFLDFLKFIFYYSFHY